MSRENGRFTGKTVLVTGAGNGIGRAAALRFVSEGACLAVADLNLTSAQCTVEDVRSQGGQAAAIEVDVRSLESCQRMVEATLKAFDGLNVLFANAGTSEDGEVTEMKESQWDKVLDTNLKGIFLTCKAAIPALKEAANGIIVTMASSMSGWDCSANGAAYMASKAGVVGLTKSLALQLAPYGIRVNAICPGIIETRLGFAPEAAKKELSAYFARFAERIPMRRVGQPQDVAAAVAFLASDDARHITGSALLIDGGQTLQSWSNAPEGAYPWKID